MRKYVIVTDSCSDLNEKLNKCKKQRDIIDRRLANRNKLIEYFSLKKDIHLKHLRLMLTNSSLIVILSLLSLP